MSQNVATMWSPGSLAGNLNSHPGKLLKEHLEGTSLLMETLSQIHKTEKIIPEKILKFVGITHDIGKANLIFQKYLEGEGEGVVHASPSAWFTLNISKEFATNKKTPLIWITEVVKHHHTYMGNAENALKNWAQSIDFQKQKEEMKRLIPSWNIFLTDEEWESYADSLIIEEKSLINEDSWLFYRMLYSLLVTADRMDALGIQTLSEKTLPSFNPPSFSPKKPTPLDSWRGKTHKKCIDSVNELEKPGLFTLTLPTGAGKTITGLDIAHEIAKKFNNKTIIYALPFISIVEQNSAVARNIFGGKNVQEDHSLSMLKGAREGAKSPWNQMKTLFRYWQSPVILTTMVQLWDAIYSPRANDTMDFHRLSNAVVIMDEPQSINPKYWYGLGETMTFLSKKLGTSFILMTATQPQIFRGKELAPQNLQFPFNRHTYKVLPGKYYLDNIPQLLEKHIEDFDKHSGLIVLNTKKAAFKVYQIMKKHLNGPVLFLSTWMTPRHRRKTMRFLKYLEKKNIKHHLISTQVIEAGVDLGFDWVFRDMGPLDSIVQVAGRCNRHCKSTKPGTVLVAELQNENNRSFCAMVYNDILLDSSRTNLKKKEINIFEEKDASLIINNYYNDISQKIADKDIWKNITNGKWGQEDKPELIENKNYFYIQEVYIEQDNKIRPILKQITETKWSLDNIDVKKHLNRRSSQYAIDVPLKELILWRDKTASILSQDTIAPVEYLKDLTSWFVTKGGYKHIYNKITGFNPVDSNDDDFSFL
jgi:CRISPR-associated endonuclease/helicase Cas3